jgi:uncharacterized protein YebE (UPF0316 family)
LGTLRIIFIARGRQRIAPVLGFFEITIWLFAIGQIMQNLSNLGCYVAFAGGFTIGNYLGIWIERKLALGNQLVRVIANKDTTELIGALRANGYGVTRLDGQGCTGPVQVVFTVVQRKEIANVLTLIRHFDPRAFYSVDDVQVAAQGIFRPAQGLLPLRAGAWKVGQNRPLRF